MKINSNYYYLMQNIKYTHGDFSNLDLNLQLLYEDLSKTKNIKTPGDFEDEHAQLLAVIQSLLKNIYTELKNIKDPNVLKNPVYKALYEDFTKHWDSQLLTLADAAKEKEPNDLANLLVFMNYHGSDLYDFAGDIQEFINTFPSN